MRASRARTDWEGTFQILLFTFLVCKFTKIFRLTFQIGVSTQWDYPSRLLHGCASGRLRGLQGSSPRQKSSRFNSRSAGCYSQKERSGSRYVFVYNSSLQIQRIPEVMSWDAPINGVRIGFTRAVGSIAAYTHGNMNTIFALRDLVKKYPDIPLVVISAGATDALAFAADNQLGMSLFF